MYIVPPRKYKVKTTLKQQKFVHEYLRTGRKDKAALAAYDVNPKLASKFGLDVYKKEGTQRYLKKVLEKAGFTEEGIADELRQLYKNVKPKKHIPDPRLSLDILKEVNKIKDNYPVERKQIDQRTAKISMEYKDKSEGELLDMLVDLTNEVKSFQKMAKTGVKLVEEKVIDDDPIL